MRDPPSQPSVLLGIAQEVDDLRQLGLRLVDAGDVCKGHAVTGGLVAARFRTAERAEHVLNVARAAHNPEQKPDEQDRRPESEQHVLPPRCARVQRLRVHDHALALEEPGEGIVVREGGNLRSKTRRRLRADVAHLLREGPLDRGAFRCDLGDVSGREVTFRGRKLTLTPREFDLLAFFVRHPGRVLVRDELLRKVWGYDYVGETRTVDVHVRRLREKLPFLEKALVTVQQFGYKLLES